MANYENMQITMGNMTKDIEALKDKLRDRDEVDASKDQMHEDQVRTQKETLIVLEKRLDTNEKHVQLLMATDEDHKKDINTLEGYNKDFEAKIKQLEEADTFLREANQEVMKKAQVIEDEEKKLSMNMVEVEDNVKDVRGTIDKRVQELKEEDEVIWKRIDGLGEDFTKFDVRIEDLKKNESEAAKGQTVKLETAIGGLAEKLKQLEGISNENAEVINQFTITHLTLEEKIDNNFGKMKNENDEQDDKLGKLERRIEDVGEDTGKIEKIVKDELRPMVIEIKDDVTIVQDNVKKIDPIIEREDKMELALEGIKENVGKLNHEVEDTEKDLEKKATDINIRIDHLAGLDKANGDNYRKAIENLENELKRQADDADAAKKELMDLVERLKQMQNDILDNQHGVGEAKDRALECDHKVQEISPVVSGHTEDIAELRNQVKGNVGSIGKNIFDIDELHKNLDGLRIEHKGMIDSLDGNSNNILRKAEAVEDELRKETARLDNFQGQINNDLREKYDDLDDKNKNNLEKIIALQEMNYNQVQKITLVESMRDQIGRMEEDKQKSEAKIQQDLAEKDQSNASKMADLQGLLDSKIKEMEGQLVEHDGDLSQLKADVKKAKEDIGEHDNKLSGHEHELQDLKPQVQQNKDDIEQLKKLKPEVEHLKENLNTIRDAIQSKIDKLDNEVKDSDANQGKVNGKVKDDLVELENKIDALKDKLGDDVKQIDQKLKMEILIKLKEDMATIHDQDDKEFRALKDLIDEKIALIEKSLEKNDGHVENLRELNKNLLEEIKANVQDQMDNQAKVTEGIKDNNTTEINNIKIDIEHKFKAFEDLKKDDVDDLKVKQIIFISFFLQML